MAGSGAIGGFSLGEIEAVLSRMFGIHATKRATFSARLQQLQRLGIPRGANPGRGVRFRYESWQVAEFALLIDLLDAGVPPNLLKTQFSDTGFYGAAGQGQLVEAAPPTSEEGIHLFLELRTLNYLRTADPSATGEHAADHIFKSGKGAALLARDDAVTPTIVINLSRRLAELRTAIDQVMPGHMDGPLFPAVQSRPGTLA